MGDSGKLRFFELDKYFPRYTQEMKRLGCIDRSALLRHGLERKACNYPNLRPFGWVSYDMVGGLYSGKLGSRSETRAFDLRSYPGLSGGNE